MATIGIEKAQVFSAAEAILATGKEPTIQAIREKLGTGSLTTISKYLKEWQAFKRNQSPVVAAPEAFNSAIQSLWALAYKEAEKLFQNQKEALLIEQQKWDEEKKVYLEEIEKLELEKHSKEHKIDESMAALKREQKVRDSMQENLAKASETSAKLRGEIEALKERLTTESERGNRLEKQLFEIARGK